MSGQLPWPGLRNQATSVQYAEVGPKPCPSTYTTLAWPWWAGWVAQWAHARNPFLFWLVPSPPRSRNIHYPSWVLLISDAIPVSPAFRKGEHLSHHSCWRIIWPLSLPLHGEPQGAQPLWHAFSAHLSPADWLPNATETLQWGIFLTLHKRLSMMHSPFQGKGRGCIMGTCKTDLLQGQYL